MDANITRITEHHFIAVFTIRLQTQQGSLYEATVLQHIIFTLYDEQKLINDLSALLFLLQMFIKRRYT